MIAKETALYFLHKRSMIAVALHPGKTIVMLHLNEGHIILISPFDEPRMHTICIITSIKPSYTNHVSITMPYFIWKTRLALCGQPVYICKNKK